MVKHLLATTAVTLALASAGLAQQAQQPVPPAQGQQQQEPQAQQPAAGTQAQQDQQQQEGEAEVTEEQPAGEPFITAQEDDQFRVDRVVGRGVVNPQGEEVGDISDLVFNEEGRLVAAVIGVGGFLGLGAKKVAVSWDQIEWTRQEEGEVELSMPFTREQLEQAPEFKDLDAQRAEEEAAAAQQRALQQQPAGAPGGMAPAAPLAPAQQ